MPPRCGVPEWGLRLAENMTADEGNLPASLQLSGWRIVAVFFISAMVLIPCWWHRRIEAGDLASHVYNAWLAQLIEKGQAPGLYIANQWNNVLFDVALLRAAGFVGMDAAQKILVPICVLVFFWGVFAFVATVTERPPWFLTPCIAMLAYGYSFSMGFMNYYLSLGLACFALAMVWRARRTDWIFGAAFAVLAMLAHPLAFLWLGGTPSYTWLWAQPPRALEIQVSPNHR